MIFICTLRREYNVSNFEILITPRSCRLTVVDNRDTGPERSILIPRANRGKRRKEREREREREKGKRGQFVVN